MTATMTSHPTATKFRQMAERLESEIAGKRGNRRENTPKQQREAASARIDADHLQRVRDALAKLADAYDAGTVPAALAGIKSKAELLDMLRTRLVSNSYYHIGDTGEYRDTTPAANALRDWLAGAKTEAEQARDAEAARQSKIRDLEATVKFSAIPGFFPSPPAVIERLLALADIQPGDWVLEPSAGKGDICDAIRSQFPKDSIAFDVLEINYTLCSILGTKGYNVHRFDFLEWKGTKYDKIIQNPPFENGQDIDHVLHAYSLLKPGGRLVSVMSTGPFYRNDKKATAFREWLAEHGGDYEDLPADSFKSAFRATSVATKIIVVDKPHDKAAQSTVQVAAADRPAEAAATIPAAEQETPPVTITELIAKNAHLLDGQPSRHDLAQELAEKIAAFAAEHGIAPGDVRLNDDSFTYEERKLYTAAIAERAERIFQAQANAGLAKAKRALAITGHQARLNGSTNGHANGNGHATLPIVAVCRKGGQHEWKTVGNETYCGKCFEPNTPPPALVVKAAKPKAAKLPPCATPEEKKARQIEAGRKAAETRRLNLAKARAAL